MGDEPRSSFRLLAGSEAGWAFAFWCASEASAKTRLLCCRATLGILKDCGHESTSVHGRGAYKSVKRDVIMSSRCRVVLASRKSFIAPRRIHNHIVGRKVLGLYYRAYSLPFQHCGCAYDEIIYLCIDAAIQEHDNSSPLTVKSLGLSCFAKHLISGAGYVVKKEGISEHWEGAFMAPSD